MASSQMSSPSSVTAKDLTLSIDYTGKDLIDCIITEHRFVDSLADNYKATNDLMERQALVFNIVRALSVHAATEEMSLYPLIMEKLPNGKEIVAHAVQEHQAVKQDLYDLDSMYVDSPGFEAQFAKVLTDNAHHIKEEETSILPQLKRALTADELVKAREDFFSKRKYAPTRPHPSAPASYPANVAANTMTVPLDATRDAMRFSSSAVYPKSAVNLTGRTTTSSSTTTGTTTAGLHGKVADPAHSIRPDSTSTQPPSSRI